MTGLVAVAVVLAVTAAGCFAAAAVLQHDAVRRHGAARAWRSRRWWTGGVAAGAGAAGHATALALAPLAVVQPLGVLAVPLGVLFERRSRSGGVTAIACAVAGVVGGVGLFTLATTAAAGLPRPPADPSRVLTVVLLVALPALALATLSALPDHVVPARLRTTGTARCLARAVPAAVAFGLVSAVLRACVEIVSRGAGASLSWLVPVGVLALAAGGAGVQSAFRSGPPSLVVACLTVVDPIAAVGVGALALDERIATGPSDVVLAAAGGLLAVAGVLLLARHHPDVVARDAAGRRLPPSAPSAPSAPTDPIPPHPAPPHPIPHTDPRRSRRPFPWRRL